MGWYFQYSVSASCRILQKVLIKFNHFKECNYWGVHCSVTSTCSIPMLQRTDLPFHRDKLRVTVLLCASPRKFWLFCPNYSTLTLQRELQNWKFQSIVMYECPRLFKAQSEESQPGYIQPHWENDYCSAHSWQFWEIIAIENGVLMSKVSICIYRRNR